MPLYKLHNDHQTMTQVTSVACGAHPLFLITLNFVNFLFLGFIVEVRFSGVLVKNPKQFLYAWLGLRHGVKCRNIDIRR